MSADKKAVEHKNNAVQRLKKRQQKKYATGKREHDFRTGREELNDRLMSQEKSRRENSSGDSAAKYEHLTHLIGRIFLIQTQVFRHERLSRDCQAIDDIRAKEKKLKRDLVC